MLGFFLTNEEEGIHVSLLKSMRLKLDQEKSHFLRGWIHHSYWVAGVGVGCHVVQYLILKSQSSLSFFFLKNFYWALSNLTKTLRIFIPNLQTMKQKFSVYAIHPSLHSYYMKTSRVKLGSTCIWEMLQCSRNPSHMQR